MSTENQILDQASLVVEVKALEKVILEKFEGMDATGKQLAAEVKDLGAAKAETIAKAEALALRVIADRLDHGETIPELRELFAVSA